MPNYVFREHGAKSLARPLVQNDNDRSSQRVSVGVVCVVVDVAVLGRSLAVFARKFALGERRRSLGRRGVTVADKGRIALAEEPGLGVHHESTLILLDLKVEVLVVEVIVVDNVALLRNWKAFSVPFN